MEHKSIYSQMDNAAISISNTAAFLRKKVDSNERPLTAVVLKHNNKLVDEWYTTVLKNICDQKGNIKAGAVGPEWEWFNDGKTIKKVIEDIKEGIIPRPSEKAVETWKNRFETCSIEDLLSYTYSGVVAGWKILETEIFVRKMIEKWDLIYSKSDDPLEWRKLANNYPKLYNMDHLNPFWNGDQLEDIMQKVMTIITNPIKPTAQQ